MQMPVSETEFETLLKEKLGAHWERALNIFRAYGEGNAAEVANCLLHAADQKRIAWVLTKLEYWHNRGRSYHHPAMGITGKLCGDFTKDLFKEMYTRHLELQPTPPSLLIAEPTLEPDADFEAFLREQQASKNAVRLARSNYYLEHYEKLFPEEAAQPAALDHTIPAGRGPARLRWPIEDIEAGSSLVRTFEGRFPQNRKKYRPTLTDD
jgi:hypothetical protein